MHRPRLLHFCASLALILCVAATSVAQQLSPATTKLRAHVQSISSGSKISILFLHEDERFGTFISAADTTFRFHDIDTQQDRTISYDDVRKVKLGYGGYNSAAHRHIDHTKALIIGGIVIGGLIALIIAGARS